jgi:hypothetical protein
MQEELQIPIAQVKAPSNNGADEQKAISSEL